MQCNWSKGQQQYKMMKYELESLGIVSTFNLVYELMMGVFYRHICLLLMDIKAWAKYLTFCRQHFQRNFHEWKWFYFDSHLYNVLLNHDLNTWYCSKNLNLNDRNHCCRESMSNYIPHETVGLSEACHLWHLPVVSCCPLGHVMSLNTGPEMTCPIFARRINPRKFL